VSKIPLPGFRAYLVIMR